MQVESLSIAESYAYSAVWLAFALALFVAGIRLGKQLSAWRVWASWRSWC